jgi:sigma-B regulation protein RsbU (phosphoserine phosphatase)
MATVGDQFFEVQLQQRRERLRSALAASSESTTLVHLLQEVDSALERMKDGTFGLCETCHESVEKDRLVADPLVRYCLDHLTQPQRRALEEDLELASRIQRALLPPRHLDAGEWQAHYLYEPAGAVSGDYCDLIRGENGRGDLLFLLGDVSGKGVAASMLMTHLHAMFRSLATVGMPLGRLLELANRVFCESTMAALYATLVCGRASRGGELEIGSAGHLPAVLLRKSGVETIPATGVPLGMFSDGQYEIRKTSFEPGDSLILYTDGLSETRNPGGTEYGNERVSRFCAGRHSSSPTDLVSAYRNDVSSFAAGGSATDDLTLLVIRRSA